MKFLIIVLVALGVAQAKFLMLPHALKDVFERKEVEESVKVALQAEQLYISTSSMQMARYTTCDSGVCAAWCFFLGYKHGECVSGDTCRCYN